MKGNKVQKTIFIVGCIVLLFFVGCLAVFGMSVLGNRGKICKNVKIDTVDVSEMTKKQATDALTKYLQKVEARSVVVEVGTRKINTTYKELGYHCDVAKYVNQAMNIGKKGSIFNRYSDIQKAKKKKTDIVMNYDFSEEAVQSFIQNECAKYDCKEKNASMKRKDGAFVIKKEKVGQVVQVAETEEAIKKALDTAKDEDVITVKAVLKTTTPNYTEENLKKCQNLLGEFSTSYASSTAARANNVQTAAGYINGTVLYPDDTFSTVETIKDRTVENGYQSAPEYSGGAVVSGIGGGVCQVATTLYNAVINAELKVVQRQPHSMTVHYVSVSRDAAIAGNYKDLKFQNDTGYPIYIEGSASGGILRFKIFGYDKRPKNRKITFESKVLQTISPGPEKTIVDSTKPESYRVVTKGGVTGYRAELWKHIFIDGKEVKKEQVNSSTYNAVPAEVTIGAKKAPTPSPAPQQTTVPQKPESTNAAPVKPQPTQKVETGNNKTEHTETKQ